MKDRVIIRLPQAELEPATAVEWLMFNAKGQKTAQDISTIDQLYGQIADLAGDIDNIGITVVASAELVLLARISIPSRQMRQIKQALPFMVEELIADEIENVHIAIPQKLDLTQGAIDAAVIQHKVLIDWLDMLLSHGISPDCITVDSLCLPYEKNAWTILLDQQRVLIRTGEFSGMAMSVDDFELIFAGLVDQWQAGNTETQNIIKPQFTVTCSAQKSSDQALCSKLAIYLRENYSGHNVKENHYKENPAEIVGTAWVNQLAAGINLLQGGYGVASNDVNSWQRWMLAASITAISIISYLVLALGSGLYFSSQAKDLKQQSVQLYKDLYPSERRIVSPKKQMQNHLRLTNTASNTAFLALLADTAKQLNTGNSDLAVTVNQLRFNSERGDLQFEVQSQSLDQLDRLKQLLANAGLQVDINSATEQDNLVMGRIVVRNL